MARAVVSARFRRCRLRCEDELDAGLAALDWIRIAMLTIVGSEFRKWSGADTFGLPAWLISSLALSMLAVYCAHGGSSRWHPLSPWIGPCHLAGEERLDDLVVGMVYATA